MSTSRPDHINLPIEDDQIQEEGTNNKVNSSTTNPDHDQKTDFMTEQLTNWYTKLKECLHHAGDKSIKDPQKEVIEKTKEGRAYKKLIEDLEYEPKEDPNSVKMWIIHALILLAFIIAISTARGVAYVYDHKVFNVQIHRWLAFFMVLVSGYPCIYFFTYVISEPFVWVFNNQKYTMFFARILKRSVNVTLWFTLVLSVWYTWYAPQIVKDTHGAYTLHIPEKQYNDVLRSIVKQITRLLMALTIGALIWTVNSVVLLKLLASLHYKELCVRIRQTILDFCGIQSIEKGQKWEFLTHKKKIKNGNAGARKANGAPSDNDEEEDLTFWMCVLRLNKDTVPIWILKRLTYIYSYHMRNNKPEILSRFENVDDDEKLMDEAKRMLHKIIGVQRAEDDEDITREDLRKMYKMDDNEISQVFNLFTPEEDGKTTEIITQDQFLRWAVLAVKNCLGLGRTIETSKRIFWKLSTVMSLCVVVITLVIWLLLTEIVTTGQLAILFTPFLSLSFITGKSLTRSFDGIMFVFGMHPFDVSDRVIIDGVEMKVNELNIVSTVFIRYDTGVEVIYPNSELATKPIVNLDITPDQPDSIEFTVPSNTRPELICDMQIKIKKSLDDDLTYTSNTTVAKKEINDKEVKMVVYFKYLVSYLSAETKAENRSKIFCKIMRLCNDMKSEQEKDMSSKEADILRFKIDAKVKFRKIHSLKNKIICVIEDYDQSLKNSSQVLFTGITKDIITMDVRVSYPEGLFQAIDDKNKLKDQIENAIKEDVNFNQRKGNILFEAQWLSKADWDDNC